MSLRPFWKRHPLLLRLVAGTMLLFSPLLMVCVVISIAWADRDEIKGLFRELWGYAVKGEM
jgi:hypothetical protein